MDSTIKTLFLGLCALLASCTSTDEPSESLDQAEVNFEFTCSENLFDYYEITAVYNQPIGEASENTVIIKQLYKEALKISYIYDRFPSHTSLQIQYHRTRQPIPAGEEVWVCMKEELTMVKDNKSEKRSIGGRECHLIASGSEPYEDDPGFSRLKKDYQNFGLAISSTGAVTMYDIFIVD